MNSGLGKDLGQVALLWGWVRRVRIIYPLFAAGSIFVFDFGFGLG